MVSASQIQEQIARFLYGEISLEEFEDWFVPATWDAHKADDRVAEALVDEIEMSLSEYTAGHLSMAELRLALDVAIVPFAENQWLQIHRKLGT